MGINLGDIAVEEGDFFGDGVKVAARLKAWRSLGIGLSRVLRGTAAPQQGGDHSLRASRQSISSRKGPQQFLR
jgi:class 3 adenylate cyclase